MKAAVVLRNDLESGFVYSIIETLAQSGSYVLLGCYQKIIALSNLTGSKIFELVGHIGYVMAMTQMLDFNPNIIASGSQDKTIKLWNLQTKSCINTLKGHTGSIRSLTPMKHKPEILASYSTDCTIRFWSVSNGDFLLNINKAFGYSILNPYVINESYLIYQSHFKGDLTVWDYLKNESKFILNGHSNMIKAMISLGQNFPNFIASASTDKSIIVWNVPAKEAVCRFNGHSKSVECITFLDNSENPILASGSLDTTIRLWSLSSFNCIAIFDFHSNGISSLFYSNNMNQFYSCGDITIVTCWKIKNNFII